MKQVLIIAPDFIPSTYPPSLRIKNFVQHLPQFGWRPTVVTVDPTYYEWPVDSETEKLLPESLEITRTKALSATLTRKIGIGDIGLRSFWHHWRTLDNLCKKKKPDLVFISVPPSFPALLGRLVHDSFGLPYVIDYIDPWVSTLYRKLPRALRPRKRSLSYAFSRVLEPYVLHRVGHITGVSRKTVDDIIARYPWLSPSDGTEIPYGGEPSDFDYVRTYPRRNRIFDLQDGNFHVNYAGVFIPPMYPTLEALFSAIRIGFERSPHVFRRLRLHFIGTTYTAGANGHYPVMTLAQKAGLRDIVDEHPRRVSYLETLQLLLDSHALIALGSDAPHYTASKIFPYILAKKPLLAVFREASSVVTILKETKAGKVITFGGGGLSQDKIQEISESLEGILSLPSGYISPTSWEAFERYTARAMTERLAKVFDEVVSS